MMPKNPIYKIIKSLEKYKDVKDDEELFNDICIIDGMLIGNIYYDSILVYTIMQKYKSELDYLFSLENRLRSTQQNQETDPSKSIAQNLCNLRHSLVRVEIMRILKRKGKEMLEDDLINQDNENLYNKFTEIMKEE